MWDVWVRSGVSECVGQTCSGYFLPLPCGQNNVGWVSSQDLSTWACGVCQKCGRGNTIVDLCTGKPAQSKTLFHYPSSPFTTIPSTSFCTSLQQACIPNSPIGHILYSFWLNTVREKWKTSYQNIKMMLYFMCYCNYHSKLFHMVWFKPHCQSTSFELMSSWDTYYVTVYLMISENNKLWYNVYEFLLLKSPLTVVFPFWYGLRQS